MRCCPKCRNVPNEHGIPWDEREIKEESYLEFRTQPMIEAALREARQEAAQEAPQPERTEQQDAACGMLPACAPLANPFVPFQRDDPPVYAAAVGAVRGTLFPGLDLPLRGQENSGELSGTLQRDLQALGEIADLTRRAQVGEERADLVCALNALERLDQLGHIRALEHLFNIH